jgi:hypothetical protein
MEAASQAGQQSVQAISQAGEQGAQAANEAAQDTETSNRRRRGSRSSS